MNGFVYKIIISREPRVTIQNPNTLHLTLTLTLKEPKYAHFQMHTLILAV